MIIRGTLFFSISNRSIREGAKIIGIYAGQDDGGASTFFAKKNEGA